MKGPKGQVVTSFCCFKGGLMVGCGDRLSYSNIYGVDTRVKFKPAPLRYMAAVNADDLQLMAEW